MEQIAIPSPLIEIKENSSHPIFFLSISIPIIPIYPIKIETFCFDGVDFTHQSSLSRVVLAKTFVESIPLL